MSDGPVLTGQTLEALTAEIFEHISTFDKNGHAYMCVCKFGESNDLNVVAACMADLLTNKQNEKKADALRRFLRLGALLAKRQAKQQNEDIQ
jgi:hypothetical protein